MKYYDVLWRKRHLTTRELHAVLTNYYSVVFWAMVISILVLLDLHGFAERVSMAALIVYTTSIIAVTLLLYYLLMLLSIKISQKVRGFFLIMPLVGFFAAILATYAVELGMSSYFGNGMSVDRALEKLPTNIILTIVLETLYLTFVLPLILSATEAIRGASTKSDSRGENSNCESITLAGHMFRCADLVWASSQDHYINVKTRDAQTLLRARMSDVVAQLSCNNGIQPHRSHWVARASVVGMECVDGHKCLRMTDGTCIPIARGRIPAVQDWLES